MKGDGAGQEEHSYLTTNAPSRWGSIRRGRPLAARGRQRCSCRRQMLLRAAAGSPRTTTMDGESDEVPGKRQPEPQMLRLEIATCVGRRWPQAAGSPCAVAAAELRLWRRRERGVCCCRGVFCNSTRCSLPSSLGRWGEVQLLRAFSSNGALEPPPHLAEDWHQPQSRAPFHHPHPLLLIFFSLHLFCHTV